MGLVKTAGQRLEKGPDLRIQRAIELSSASSSSWGRLGRLGCGFLKTAWTYPPRDPDRRTLRLGGGGQPTAHRDQHSERAYLRCRALAGLLTVSRSFSLGMILSPGWLTA